MSFKDKLIIDKVPKHVAIIMDGNGRWAAQFGNERTFGHEHGVEAVRSVVEGAGEIGVKYLTLFNSSSLESGSDFDSLKIEMLPKAPRKSRSQIHLFLTFNHYYNGY